MGAGRSRRTSAIFRACCIASQVCSCPSSGGGKAPRTFLSAVKDLGLAGLVLCWGTAGLCTQGLSQPQPGTETRRPPCYTNHSSFPGSSQGQRPSPQDPRTLPHHSHAPSPPPSREPHAGVTLLEAFLPASDAPRHAAPREAAHVSTLPTALFKGDRLHAASREAAPARAELLQVPLGLSEGFSTYTARTATTSRPTLRAAAARCSEPLTPSPAAHLLRAPRGRAAREGSLLKPQHRRTGVRTGCFPDGDIHPLWSARGRKPPPGEHPSLRP